MSGLGPSAFTAASHFVMVVVLVLLGVRGMRFLPDNMRAVFGIACAALAIERLYYLMARLLHQSSVDLWSMHPAPEVLALIVGIGLYGVMIPIVLSEAERPGRAAAKLAKEGALILILWAALGWVLF